MSRSQSTRESRWVGVKVRVDAVGVPGVKVPEVELEEAAAGAVSDVQVEELRPPPDVRSRERLLSRYAVVEGEGTVELGNSEEGEVDGAVRDRNALRYQCGSHGPMLPPK